MAKSWSSSLDFRLSARSPTSLTGQHQKQRKPSRDRAGEVETQLSQELTAEPQTTPDLAVKSETQRPEVERQSSSEQTAEPESETTQELTAEPGTTFTST